MIITSLFAVFFIILILIICYFIMEILHFKMSKNSIIQAFISLVLVFIAFQFIRLVIDLTLLQVQDINLIDNESFLSSLKKTNWFQYISISNYLMILTGIIVFGIEMSFHENKQNRFEIFILTCVFSICYIIILL